MSGQVRGVYPGGPGREARGGASRPWIPTMAERSKAAARGQLDGTRRRRRRRLLVGALVTLIGAGAIGVVAGRGLGASAHEQAARADSAAALDRAVSKEVNRVLLELWKMEGMEVRP